MNVAKAKRMANEVLSELGEFGLPINIDRIADSYGLEVYESNLNDNISGVFEPKGKAGVIHVNTDHSEQRKRFSVAHELGHFILGHCDGVHVDKIYRNKASSMAISPKEIEANNFASEILMPKKMVEKHLQKLVSNGTNKFDILINELKEIFNVSKQAMKIKLTSLGYNDPEG